MQQIFPLLVLATFITIVSPSPQITVYPSVYTINQVATYIFTIDIGNGNIFPGLASLTFNSSVYDFTNSPGIPNCYSSINNSTRYNCAASGATISFNWTSSYGTVIYLNVDSIKNPSYVSNFNVTLSYGTGGTFTPVVGTINGLLPDTLLSCSMSYSPSYTNSYSAVTFNIVNKNDIPSGGSLQLTFNNYTPASNTSNLAITTTNSAINTSTVTTNAGSFFGFNNFFKDSVTANNISLIFTLSFFLTPPTTSSTFYSITILTYSSTSYQNKIDESTCNITGITDYPTPNMSVYTTGTLRVGDTLKTLSIDFKAPTLVNFSTDKISVQVSSSSTTYLLVYCLSIAVSTNATTGFALANSNSSFGVQFPKSTVNTSIASNTPTSITSGIFFDSVVNSGAKNITIQFFRSNVSYSNNSAILTVLPNFLINATFLPVTTLVLTSTTYSFVMQIRNPLGIGAVIVITLPTNITITQGNCNLSAALSASSSLSSAGGIVCNAAGQKITVSNISSTILPANTIITLNISGITNPATTRQTASIFYQTFYNMNQTANPVDDSTGFSMLLNPTAVTIPNSHFNVSRADLTNLKYTSYTFNYKVFTSFPANGIINIIFPAFMQLSSGATASYVLNSSGTNQTASISSKNNSSFTTIILTLSTPTDFTNTDFTITIKNILNYYSYKPINVQIVTQTADGFAVEQSNSTTLTPTNSVPDTALVASDSNSNTTINGNTISYTFSIKTTSVLSAADLISIELQLTNNVNTQLLFITSTVSCTVNSNSVNCTKDLSNSKLLYITVGNTYSAGTTLSVIVSSVILTRSLEPPGNITVSTFEVSGGISYLISTCTFTPANNSKPDLINIANLIINDNGISSARLNTPTSFTLSFQPKNLLTTGDYIVVSIPRSDWIFKTTAVVVTDVNAISTMNGSLCSSSNVFCSNHNNDSNLIRVDDKNGTAFPANTNISFTFPSTIFASTKQWADSYSNLSFNTYSKAHYSIDSSSVNSTSNKAAFTLACPNTNTSHCKTCNSTGFCLSCYQPGEGLEPGWNYASFNIRQSTGECVSSCGTRYYNLSNTCELCTIPCYSCTNGLTTSCTSCIAPTVLINTTCNASCSSGYYNNSGVCAQCSSPCATCVTTSTNCLSCNSGTYLNGNNCGNNCNGLTGYFTDNATWTCKKCIDNCTDCAVIASNCTTCNADYFLQSPGVCTMSCPNGSVKISSILCGCDYTLCDTCALTTTTCTTCKSPLVLLNSKCTTSCGSGYYVSNLKCVACVTDCNNCTVSGCTECSSTASFLYNGSCYSSCPTGTISSLKTCIACPSGCSVCSNSTVCTSCQSIYYLVVNSDLSTSCVSSCTGSTPYVQSSKCVSACTPPLVADNRFCVSTSTSNNTDSGSTNKTNTTNSTNNTLTTSSSKIIPMPVTIALFTLASVTVVSKITFQSTIIWASLSAFGGLCEIIAWFIFIIIVIADSTVGSLSKIGMMIVIAAFAITVILNVISFYFFKKYIWVDDKFENHKKKIKKTKCSLSMTYFFVGISIVFSHKWLDIIFSNLFQVNHCIYKVSIVNKLTPLNYLRYTSILASIVAIGGAGAAGYDMQTYGTSSIIFMQSIDLIIVTVVACIFSIVVTKRNAEEYQNTNGLKTNDIQEEFQHDPVEDDINHFEKEQKSRSYRQKYNYSSSIRGTDIKEKPLQKKKLSNRNPIGEENNLTNMPLDNHEEDNNRVSLNDMTGLTSGVFKKTKKRTAQGLNIQEIDFIEQSGDNLLPSKSTQIKKNNSRYSESEKLKRQAQQKQKKKLKASIQSKLNEQQRQKAKVIGQVDVINTALLSERHGQNSDINLNQLSKKERKKEKLDVLQTSDEGNLSKLSEKERQKAGDIKDAMDMLKAKKITIDDYLQYLDIIEEQDEDKNSDDYQNKNISLKNKGKGGNKSNNKKSKNLVKSLKKNDRRQQSARYQKDPKIFVQHQNDFDLGRGESYFQQEKQPQQPDFHQTPIRVRNQSEQFEPSDLQQLKLSEIRKLNNRSGQNFFKNKQLRHERLLSSLQSGDNDDPSLADQFQRGNTLYQVEKDDLPPSNLYQTQYMRQKSDVLQINFPTPANRIGPNRLINQGDQIQYIESDGADIQTLKGQLLGFDNDISPSQFDEPNQRIQNQKTSNAPTKPRVVKGGKQEFNEQGMQVEDLEDVYDEFQNQYSGQEQHNRLQRYQSDRNLDYDEILLQKRRNEKQKQLQKIYLPRLDVTRSNKKKKKTSKSMNSGRSDLK